MTTLRRQFVRLGWMMLALSVASGFVWLVVLASRLTGQSLQAMAGPEFVQAKEFLATRQK